LSQEIMQMLRIRFLVCLTCDLRPFLKPWEQPSAMLPVIHNNNKPTRADNQ
jgi:hypothetical protein